MILFVLFTHLAMVFGMANPLLPATFDSAGYGCSMARMDMNMPAGMNHDQMNRPDGQMNHDQMNHDQMSRGQMSDQMNNNR